MKNLASFLRKSEKKVFDLEHRKRINYNISKYNSKVPLGKEQFADYELARDKAAHVKRKVINNFEKYLIEFDNNFTKNGGEVFWASDADEAVKIIIELCKKHDVKSVVKAKSMVTEEISLNKYLERNKIEPIETDLGEFIVQLENEPPYHIVTPAMHKSKEDVANLFHERFGTPVDFTPEQLTQEARKILRKKFINADAGISGANFLISDIGAISITENEGNARLATSIPKIHIAISGIEKLLPSINDLALFLPLLATVGTGQRITTYNTLLFGPKKHTEMDGPEKMYLVLLDNGRTDILKAEPQRTALACIRCGACLNICPVYKNIGGHTYNSAYNGPIGSIITPFIKGMEDYIHLSYASSLCGACSSVCPVKIDLADLLLKNRLIPLKHSTSSRMERNGWKYWARFMMKRKRANFGGYKLKNRFIKIFLNNSWNKRRKPLQVAKKSFNQYWIDQKSEEKRL